MRRLCLGCEVEGTTTTFWTTRSTVEAIRDGFGSDTHGYEFGCHCLPHFISNSDTNTNIIEYEYKTDISNSDSHSNTYSIYSIKS
jgi:hypothetical protein